MPGGNTDPAPSVGLPVRSRLFTFRSGEFHLVSSDTDSTTTTLDGDRLPPIAHSHGFIDLPDVVAFAVGTNTARPYGARLCLWIAPAEPVNAVIGDIWLNDPDS